MGVFDRMFNQQEVQILIGGVNTPIDIADLQQHTNYGGLYDASHPTIRFFWQVVESFDQEQKKGLLRFVTSCSRPPLLGFRELVPNFSIRDATEDQYRLPTSSTCVNLLKVGCLSVWCFQILTKSLVCSFQDILVRVLCGRNYSRQSTLVLGLIFHDCTSTKFAFVKFFIVSVESWATVTLHSNLTGLTDTVFRSYSTFPSCLH